MHHDIGSVKNILPVRDALNIDEVHDAAVNQAIQNIAKPAPSDETEAVILIGLNVLAPIQIQDEAAYQYNTEEREDPAMSLQHSKHATKVANVREVDERTPLHCFT